ncbi:extracellular solute-binding protein [Clostridium oryzae]|uniref:Lipoprotein LipO n=1 Tax=Clostridium oryzae TaxID=1450648 RepID=A0A1V4IJD3_9CLOT|nr:extracellular solute-binding protein [Clostridium oryzae]OPJ60033.1 lipoprotein LipO precursor [Clostridium oryzae]
MKKALKRSISFVVLAGVLCGGMIGCKGKDATKHNTEKANGFQTKGLPIVKKPVTFKVLTMRWANMGDSFTKNKWLQDLETKTNVKIKWEIKSSNDWDTQKQVLLSSGELPDIIIGDGTFSDSDIVNNESLFRPVDDLVKKYMPNYQTALREYPDLKKTVTFPDGKMYSFGSAFPILPKVCNQPIINKTWLKKLGMKEPTTIDELEKVLQAFKTKDPNGNGKADEIPIIDIASMDLLNPFGITDLNGNNMIVKGDGSLEYYPTSEQYKAGIKWLQKLYSEGLIDREAFTEDATMVTSKRQAPDAARVGFTYAWTPDATFGKWSSQYEAIAPIKGPDGKQYASGDPNGNGSIGRNSAEISTSCKYPEVAARWIDQFYTGEASIQNFWGAIGTVVKKNSDNTYTLNDPPKGTSADAWYWDQSLRSFSPKYISADFKKKIKLSPKSGDGLKIELGKLGDPYVTTPFPKVMYTNDENEELPTLTTDINTYVQQTRAKWIIKGGIDQGWDAYVKKLKDMGLDKLVKIYTDGYNRYEKVK